MVFHLLSTNTTRQVWATSIGVFIVVRKRADLIVLSWVLNSKWLTNATIWFSWLSDSTWVSPIAIFLGIRGVRGCLSARRSFLYSVGETHVLIRCPTFWTVFVNQDFLEKSNKGLGLIKQQNVGIHFARGVYRKTYQPGKMVRAWHLSLLLLGKYDVWGVNEGGRFIMFYAVSSLQQIQ